jgi:hypothetical protein
MTCVLSTAIAKPCGDGVSGLKKIWAVEWDALDSITETAGVITAMTLDGVKAFFGWSFEPGQAQMTANINRSRENGTLFYEHKLNVKFNRYETTKRNEIKIVSAADLAIIALDRNGKYWLLGRVNGMTLESGTGDSGKAMGDFNGFELNFTGMEEDLPIEVNSATVTSLSLT